MKTSVNACQWNSYASWKGTEKDWKTFVREAAEAGYEGVELAGHPDKLGPADEVVDFVKSLGLEISAFGGGMTVDYHEPARERNLSELKYMEQLGVDTKMVCGGFLGPPRRTVIDAEYVEFAEQLAWLCDEAEQHGVSVAFHPHRGSIVETGDELEKVLSRVPKLRICVDIAHLEACHQDAMDFIERFSEKIIYTHIKDFHWGTKSFMEMGQGDSKLDPGACVKLLIEKGYQGWMVAELDRRWEKTEGMACPDPLTAAKVNREYLRAL